MGWLSAITGLLKLLGGLFGFFRDRKLRNEGAAMQRDQDMRAENDRLEKADVAADRARAGGVSGAQSSPYNRDNR